MLHYKIINKIKATHQNSMVNIEIVEHSKNAITIYYNYNCNPQIGEIWGQEWDLIDAQKLVETNLDQILCNKKRWL